MPEWLVRLKNNGLAKTEIAVTADRVEIRDGALIFSDVKHRRGGDHKQIVYARNKDEWRSVKRVGAPVSLQDQD